MSDQSVCSLATLALARRVDLLLTLVTPVACRARALGVVALVDLCVCVTKLDRNVPLQLVLETDGLHTGDSLDNRTLSVGDVANGTDVDGRLPGDNLRGERCEARDIQVFGLGLLGELWS